MEQFSIADLKLSTSAATASPTQPSPDSERVVLRLKRLAVMRRTAPPEHVEDFAEKLLRRFDYNAIDRMCGLIEETRREKGEAAFPDLGTLIDECRALRTQQKLGANDWTIKAYAEAKTFDLYRRDEIEHRCERDAKAGRPVNRSAVVDVFDRELREKTPSQYIAWLAWAKQRRDGTLNCPGWCDECEGERVVTRYEDGSKPWSNGPYGHGYPENNAAETARRRSLNTIAIACPSCRGRL